MFTDVLEQIDKGKKIVAAVVAEGRCPGYRCIADNGKIVYESSREAGGAYKRLKEEMQQIEVSCCKEIDGERVFFEVLEQRPRLVICGGGHVAIAVVRLAEFLHFQVTVIEDRPAFADQARAAGAQEVICDSFEHGLAGIDGEANIYFVIVTRGHRFDKVCFSSILKKPYAYVGMMGSRSRIKLLKQSMEAEGWQKEKLNSLHAPIGLDINSETPEEIAVSILGEIISVKNSKEASEGFTKEIKEGLLEPGKKVLATIIMRKGSAPRQIGTKMVILEDGAVKGTIGGGCAEAELLREARLLLRSGGREVKVVRVNMTNQDAAEEGMVCGGLQDILLETFG